MGPIVMKADQDCISGGPSPVGQAAAAGESGSWRSGIPSEATTAVIWTAIWIVAFLAVRWLHAAGGRGGAVATPFTETTLLSLGGTYAVVPSALDESGVRGWLAAAERFDSLAMGEATPGHLILVVTFIGFLAGWRTDPAGAAAASASGAALFRGRATTPVVVATAAAVGAALGHLR
jgi:chromate transporter